MGMGITLLFPDFGTLFIYLEEHIKNICNIPYESYTNKQNKEAQKVQYHSQHCFDENVNILYKTLYNYFFQTTGRMSILGLLKHTN